MEVCFAIRIFQSGWMFALLTLVKRASTPWCLIFNLRLSFSMLGNREQSTWDAVKMPQIAPLNWPLPVAPYGYIIGTVSYRLINYLHYLLTSRWCIYILENNFDKIVYTLLKYQIQLLFCIIILYIYINLETSLCILKSIIMQHRKIEKQNCKV